MEAGAAAPDAGAFVVAAAAPAVLPAPANPQPPQPAAPPPVLAAPPPAAGTEVQSVTLLTPSWRREAAASTACPKLLGFLVHSLVESFVNHKIRLERSQLWQGRRW